MIKKFTFVALCMGALMMLTGADNLHSPSVDHTHSKVQKDLTTFVVNVDRARFLAKAPAAPLEFWVANRGQITWHFNRDSFSLSNPEGKSMKPMDHVGLFDIYPGYRFDKRWLKERVKPTGGLLDSLGDVPANFYPMPSDTDSYGFFTENVGLARRTIAKSLVYFPGDFMSADGTYSLSLELVGVDRDDQPQERTLTITFPMSHVD